MKQLRILQWVWIAMDLLFVYLFLISISANNDVCIWFCLLMIGVFTFLSAYADRKIDAHYKGLYKEIQEQFMHKQVSPRNVNVGNGPMNGDYVAATDPFDFDNDKMIPNEILYHLRMIPDPVIRAKAIATLSDRRVNIRDLSNPALPTICSSIPDALHKMAFWAETEDGHDYWYEVYNSFLNNTKL